MTIPLTLKASHSESDQFKRCPRAWYYNYKMQIVPNNPGVHLVRGNIGHAALADYYQQIKDGKGHDFARRSAMALCGLLIDGVGEFYKKDELRAELAITLRDYFRWVEPEAGAIEVIEVEKRFDIEIEGTNGFTLPFVVDLIVRRPGLGVEAWDHKFVYDFYNPSLVDLSPQLPLYYAGLKLLGQEVGAVRYNEIRYRPTAAIKADYTKRFNRPNVPVIPARVMNTMRDHIRVGKMLYELKKLDVQEVEGWTWRRESKDCAGCDYNKICIGDLNDEDRNNYIGIDYKTKEKR